MESAEAEGAAAVGSLPRPGHGFPLSIQGSTQDRLNTPLRFGEFQSIIEFLMNAEIIHASADRVLGVDNLHFRFDHLVLAIGTTVAAAQELQEAVDRLRLASANRPVQSNRPTAARGQLAESLLPAGVGGDPAGSLGEVKDDTISLFQELRPLFPGIVRADDLYFQSGYRLETFGQNSQDGHVFMSLWRVAIGTLSQEQESLGGPG